MKDIAELVRNPEQLEKLKEIYLRSPRDTREESVRALKEVKDENAARFLASVLADETDREIQKLIRKQIFRLKTMGIKVEELRPAGESALKKMEDRRQHKGFMSNYDTGGIRVVVLAFEAKKNNFLLVNAVIHFSDGLTDLRLVPVTRQDLDMIIDEYRSDTARGVVLAEISSKYGAYLIEESDAVFHRFAEDVKQLKQFVSTMKDEIEKPEDIYGLKPPEGTEPLSVSASLTDGIFAPFSLTWPTMEEDRQRFGSLGSSDIVLPPHMIKERQESFLKGLIEAEPLKSKTPLVKRMLEDYAYILFQTGRFDCFQGILDLLRNEKGPFMALAFFVGKSLPPEETEKRQPGVIIDPYEQIRR